MMACSQILALSWRLGGDEAECEQAFEEGRALAEAAGDLSSLASLTSNYAGFVGITLGRGGDYVRYCKDAARIADETGDLALRCGNRAYHLPIRQAARELRVAERTLRSAGN